METPSGHLKHNQNAMANADTVIRAVSCEIEETSGSGAVPAGWPEITKISWRIGFIFSRRVLVEAHPENPMKPTMKSHSSSRRSAECADAWRSSCQISERPQSRTPQSIRGMAPSFSESATRANARSHSGGRQRFGRPFHFLVFISLSCCALLRICPRPAGWQDGDEAA